MLKYTNLYTQRGVIQLIVGLYRIRTANAHPTYRASAIYHIAVLGAFPAYASSRVLVAHRTPVVAGERFIAVSQCLPWAFTYINLIVGRRHLK